MKSSETRGKFAAALALACAAAAPVYAQIERDVDEGVIRLALRQGAEELPEVERRWRESFAPDGEDEQSFTELFGYNPPGHALGLAYLHAFLFERGRLEEDAAAPAGYLARMADYRADVPDRLREARVEYAGGLPAVPSFFHLADYCEAWTRVRDCAAVEDAVRRKVDEAVVSSAEFIFVFPEWGAHNRAVLRAECLLYAARALPDHPSAARWRRMADVLAAGSLGRWEIEDAQIYHPIWLDALARFGGDDVLRSVQGRYYLRYFLELLAPDGTMPDFGDGWWRNGLARYYACFERGAAALGDPELEWAARRVYAAMGPMDPERPGLGRPLLYAHLAGHLSDLEPRAPELASGPVLDDVVGKKLVLRDGAGEEAFYLLLNYRDEGDWGRLDRDYLRRTLAVEEEKMHHGHSDEGSVVLMMHGGSVLLHDAGYRERAPSGPFGAYRADLFHNRLVARRGRPEEGQGALEFLRGSGAYRGVRTELIDFAALGPADYGRTRLTDAELGYVWDRTLVALRGAPAVVVLDTVATTVPGTFTFANLWAAQHVRRAGPGYAVCANETIGTHSLRAGRELLLVLPGLVGAPPHFALRRHNQEERVLHEMRSAWCPQGRWQAFVTVLWSVPPGADAERTARRVSLIPVEPEGAGVAVRIEGGGGLPTTTVVLKADLELGLLAEGVRPRYDPQAGSLAAGGLRSDADLVVLQEEAGGTRWSAVNMTHVTLDGRTVFESSPLQVFQVTGRSDVVGRVKWRLWEGGVPE